MLPSGGNFATKTYKYKIHHFYYRKVLHTSTNLHTTVKQGDLLCQLLRKKEVKTS